MLFILKTSIFIEENRFDMEIVEEDNANKYPQLSSSSALPVSSQLN